MSSHQARSGRRWYPRCGNLPRRRLPHVHRLDPIADIGWSYLLARLYGWNLRAFHGAVARRNRGRRRCGAMMLNLRGRVGHDRHQAR